MPTWSINNRVRTPLLILGVLEVTILFLSVYLAGVVLFGNLQLTENVIGVLWPRALIVSAVMLVCLIAVGLYQFHQRAYFHEVLVRVFVALAASGVLLAAVFYVFPAVSLPVDMAVFSAIVSLLVLLFLRYLFVRNVDENIFRRRTLILGAGERASAVAELRRRADRRGFRVVGQVAAVGDSQNLERPSGLIENRKSLVEVAKDTGAEEIVVAMDERRGNLPVRELLDCKLRGINVIELVDFLERETGLIRIDLVSPGWLIFSSGFQVTKLSRLVKRLLDLAVASVVLIVGMPIMLAIALAIKLSEGMDAPIFYKQRRVGYRGALIDLIKFRSMRVDAEADGQAVWAQENDDRVTQVGGFLRKCRLDELPQVFNVLRGEMSLVGPRPERPEFVHELSQTIPYYAERHTARPGVTGWAQLKYAYGASEEDSAMKLQYDLYYVKNQSLMLDLMILIQTVEVVLWGKGAR